MSETEELSAVGKPGLVKMMSVSDRACHLSTLSLNKTLLCASLSVFTSNEAIVVLTEIQTEMLSRNTGSFTLCKRPPR